MTPQFQQWAEHTVSVLRSDLNRFAGLMRPGLTTWPIPFFGPLSEAEVITIGVNPSWTEFNHLRWRYIRTERDAVALLWNYFQSDPHRWFTTWETALNHLNCSYSVGHGFRAAHVDVSFRATVAMGAVSDSELFRRMVKHDLPHFAATLRQAEKVRLVLLSGAVTDRFYINEFLGRFLPSELLSLRGSFSRTSQPGPGKTSYHTFDGFRCVPAFFCSCSPGSKNPELLVRRVQENKLPLMRRLEG